MAKVAAWRLYYGDGSTFASTDGAWEAAPNENVQVVMLYLDERDYRQIMQGEDVYRLPGERAVKYGRWMDDASYAALVERALSAGPPLNLV